MLVRILSALLGLYVFTSAFLWPRGAAQFFNLFLVGLLAMGFGLASILGRPAARRVNFGLAVWLFVSALALPPGPHLNTTGGLANQLVSAVLLAITALFPAARHYREAPRAA
jgi:hypothetical protein